MSGSEVALATADDAIDRFAAAGNEPPREALHWALDHWDAAGPHFLALLRAYADGTDRSERTEQALFFVLHLLAEKTEAAAFAPLCRLLADAEAAELVLGDALTQTLAGLLVSTFNGDAAMLVALAEQETADEFARENALVALAYLTRAGSLAEDATRDTLRRLLHALRPQGPHVVWLGWVMAVAHLGFTDLAADAEALIRRGFVPRGIMHVSHFRQDIRCTLDDASGMAGFAAAGIGPSTDTLGMLESWAALGDGEEGAPEDDEAAGEYEPQEPHHNPLRHVGRNDPCPCGSGRKFKKCCMPA